MTPQLSAVVAVSGSSGQLADWLAAVRPQVARLPAGSVEVLVCHRSGAANDPDESDDPHEPGEPGIREQCDDPWIRILPGAQHALVPQLWSDGISAARAPRVALSVVDCVPDSNWLDALLAADLATYCAVGGAIDCEPGADSVGMAIYLLRYARYARPFAALETTDLPGDNALYDRTALIPHSAAYADGFWEPEIHALLHAEGRLLLRDPAIAAFHRNRHGAFEFAAQRLAHGRRYGRDRAQAMPRLKRALYLAASPAVPLILGAKIVRLALARSESRRALPLASLPLSLFLLAWGAGEFRGILDAVLGRTSQP